MDDLSQWYDAREDEIVRDYFEFLKIPSISADLKHRSDLLRCASWVEAYLKKSGLSARQIPTTGAPIVYAECLEAGPKKRTLLIYGHYDVQPADPLDLWESDPFQPTERNGNIYARGAVDDKGQILYAMAAVRALKEKGPLPVNVKFCIEGEEETSSVGLAGALSSISNELKADDLLVVDFNSFDETTPSINLGARGMLTLEIGLTGSSTDLHSGVLGGVAYNPIRALTELLAKLYDRDGRVAIAGFYDSVKAVSPQELAQFAFPYSKEYYKDVFGIEEFGGEKGCSLKEANYFRPTIEINGIYGGYAGEGVKTVIPAKAGAKLSCRLVMGQDPKKIGEQIEHFLRAHAPAHMKLEVKIYGGFAAYRGKADSKLAKASMEAAFEVTGKRAEKVLSGASIPVIAPLSSAIGADVVGIGYCLNTDQIHAPNEHFSMDRFKKGFLTIAKTIGKL
jgi:acetylornithine deacetylase/succinyl-diaminopimelate desuccinylase-like protein